MKGIPLTLRCVFLYGAPPISCVLIKLNTNAANGQPTFAVYARGGREVSVALNMTRESDIGDYRCRAQDARGDTIIHNIRLSRVGK